MAKNPADDDKSEGEEEEEALSLCDLPINREENKPKKEELAQSIEEDFEFGSRAGSNLTEPEMCAADEVFFRGQILPLRHSVSSESGLAMLPPNSRSVSRSESMDRFYSGQVISSRCSSIRSQYSSSSGSSTTTTTTTTTNHKQRVQNRFHSHPSPKPQIRGPGARYGNLGQPSPKSTVWSFFRVGLLRTPEIELHRTNITKANSTFGSRNSSSSTSSSNIDKNGTNIEKKKKKGNVGFFGDCKCSIDVVETINSRVVVKSDKGKEEDQKENATTTKKTKQAMSRHRTFEWLKELSISGVPEEA